MLPKYLNIGVDQCHQAKKERLKKARAACMCVCVDQNPKLINIYWSNVSSATGQKSALKVNVFHSG